MVLSTWKKSTLARAGTAQQFGSNDLNRVSDLLNGYDVGPVEIGATWNFTRAPTGWTIAAGSITDSMINGSAAIAYAKLALANSIQNTDIATHTSTKISITNKAQLPADTLYKDDAQTITGKTIGPWQNTLQGHVIDPIVKRTGWAVPGANSLKLYGALADHTNGTVGTIASAWDTTEGIVINIPTTSASGVQAGLVSPTTATGITRRAFGTRARVRAKIDSTTSARRYFGFTSLATLPISDTPLGASDHGVIVGFNSTDSYYTIRNNDGTAVNTQVVTGNIAKDALFHTLEINWTASGNVNVIVDSTTVTLSTKLPGTNTNLFFNDTVQTSAIVSRIISYDGVWAEVDE